MKLLLFPLLTSFLLLNRPVLATDGDHFPNGSSAPEADLDRASDDANASQQVSAVVVYYQFVFSTRISQEGAS